MIFKLKIGKRLIKAGIITREQLRKALELQKENGYKLGYNLVSLGYIDEETLASFLAEQYNTPALSPSILKIDDVVFKLIPPEIMKEHFIIPISKVHNTLTIAMADPSDEKLVNYIENLTGFSVKPVVSPQSAIKRMLDKKFFRESLPKCIRNQLDVEHISSLFSELNDYKIIDIIGEGGFGKVFKCLQVSLDRFVAVKTLSKSLARSREIVERFKREAKIVARLNHPNIVRIIEQGEINDYYYFVMEFIEGVPMHQFLKDKDIVMKLSIFIQVCDALSHAHKLNVVHRDIKPLNILVEKNGNIKLLDFGISLINIPGDKRITDPFLVLGTPKYMSPEQSRNPLEVDHLADIYAVGVIMFEIFSGVDFIQDSMQPPISYNTALPEELSNAILCCLKADRKERFQSCDELKVCLSIIRDKIVLGSEINSNKSMERIEPLEDNAIIKNKYEFITILKNENGVETILAEHKLLDKLVIIKRFTNKQGAVEARLLSRLKHSHIVDVLGMAENEDKYIVVTEYLNGGTIDDKIKSKPTIKEIISIMKSIVSALDFAYKNKIVHNNLHPNNILFDASGELKIADFNITSTAPESFRKFIPHKFRNPLFNDLFSLGILLFEMISGRLYDCVGGPEKNFYLIRDFKISPGQIKTVLAKLWGISRIRTRYNSYPVLISDLEFLEKETLSISEGHPTPIPTSFSYSKKESENKAKISKERIEELICITLLIILFIVSYISYTIIVAR